MVLEKLDTGRSVALDKPLFPVDEKQKRKNPDPGEGGWSEDFFFVLSIYLLKKEYPSRVEATFFALFAGGGEGVDSMAPKRMIYQETTLEIFSPSVHITSSTEILQEHMK